jgi:serine protease Do
MLRDWPFDNFFKRFDLTPGDEPSTRDDETTRMKRQALGSGFIVDPRGYVVTNAHVVKGADRVRVRLADERELDAKVKGRDERLDLAVLQIEGAKQLPAAALGSSEAVRVGDYVIAIGNPFGLGHTVTMGIVSAKSRSIGAGPYDDFIQTDASINPGNSGGPLFNTRGEVIAVNTAINPNGKGIGFAIPVDALKEVLPQLIDRGRVSRGRIGVHVQAVDEAMSKALGMDAAKGALVADVEPGSAGERSGIKAGDVIVRFDGHDVLHSQDLPRMVAARPPGTRVKVDVVRERGTRTLDVTLDELKADETSSEEKDDASEWRRDGSGESHFGLDLDDGPDGCNRSARPPRQPSGRSARKRRPHHGNRSKARQDGARRGGGPVFATRGSSSIASKA